MTYAMMEPLKLPVMEDVPPPPDMLDSEIPKGLFKTYTPKERAEHQAQFEKRANDDFYNEWFLFPYSDYSGGTCKGSSLSAISSLSSRPAALSHLSLLHSIGPLIQSWFHGFTITNAGTSTRLSVVTLGFWTI